VKILVVFLVGPFAFFFKDRAAYVRIRFGPRLGLSCLASTSREESAESSSSLRPEVPLWCASV